MIIEDNSNDWMVYVQHITIGQCFYYADNLYLRIHFIDRDFEDKVIAVDFNKNELKVFPYNIRVVPVNAKITVDRSSDQVSHLRLVKSTDD